MHERHALHMSQACECLPGICADVGSADCASLLRYACAGHVMQVHSTAVPPLLLVLIAQHITAQHSTAQHSTAQHSTAEHSTAVLCLLELIVLQRKLNLPSLVHATEVARYICIWKLTCLHIGCGVSISPLYVQCISPWVAPTDTHQSALQYGMQFYVTMK